VHAATDMVSGVVRGLFDVFRGCLYVHLGASGVPSHNLQEKTSFDYLRCFFIRAPARVAVVQKPAATVFCAWHA